MSNDEFEQAYELLEWVAENDGYLSLAMGRSRFPDGSRVNLYVESPINSEDVIGGISDTLAGAIEEVKKGMAYVEKNKGEYLVEGD